MNEIIFFTQSFLIIGFVFWASKLGRDCLISWVAIQALIANLFVVKQITLFGFDVTASDAFAIGSLLGLNFLQEYYSREDAARATRICFFFMLFFALVSQLHLIYEPNFEDSSQQAFNTILSLTPRLLIASMGVFFIVQQIDILLFAFLKRTLSKVSFAIRAGLSLVVSECLDTLLFSFAGLYGVVASVLDIFVLSYVIKLIVIACFTFIVKLANRGALKRS